MIRQCALWGESYGELVLYALPCNLIVPSVGEPVSWLVNQSVSRSSQLVCRLVGWSVGRSVDQTLMLTVN